ncbi:hypothetical protein WN943_006114 [Citrus x changshan-huyou]
MENRRKWKTFFYFALKASCGNKLIACNKSDSDDGKKKSDSNEGETRSEERSGEKVDGQGEENEDQELEKGSDDNWLQRSTVHALIIY